MYFISLLKGEIEYDLPDTGCGVICGIHYQEGTDFSDKNRLHLSVGLCVLIGCFRTRPKIDTVAEE